MYLFRFYNGMVVGVFADLTLLDSADTSEQGYESPGREIERLEIPGTHGDETNAAFRPNTRAITLIQGIADYHQFSRIGKVVYRRYPPSPDHCFADVMPVIQDVRRPDWSNVTIGRVNRADGASRAHR